jgi:hypothetical protein
MDLVGKQNGHIKVFVYMRTFASKYNEFRKKKKYNKKQQIIEMSINKISLLFIFKMYFNYDSWVSECLLFNANSAIFQLYHGENKLIFIEMMMSSTLY